MTRTDAIRKIKALLARADADRNDNEHERERALHQATVLMDQFAVQSEDINDSDDLGARGSDWYESGSNIWVGTVINAIGSLYGCRVYRSGKGKRARLAIIGRAHFRGIVVDMSRWIIDSINREASTRYAPDSGASLRAYRHAFRTGAAMAIGESVKEIKRSRKRGDTVEGGHGQALVVVQRYLDESRANDRWLQDQGIRLSGGTRGSYSSRSGLDAGRAYGSGISLSGQMTGSGQKRLR